MIDGLTLDVAGRAVAAALLHSVWQGALAAGLVAVALRVLRGASAQARYAVACAALAGLVGAFAITAARTASAATNVEGGLKTALTSVPAAPLLGAGFLDFSAAIQPLPPSDADRQAIERSWRSRLERWSAAAVPLWLAGVLLLSLRLMVEWIAIERMRRVRVAPVAADLRARVAALAHTLGVSRPVRIAHSTAVQVPSVVGWLRPLILLPASALTGLSPAQLDAVLAHELAHVRRHDFAVNALQTAAEVVLFYHPACWWISRRIRVEREHCCDDAAVAVCGDRLIYASALADLETLRQPPALALAATDGPLLQRVRRLVTPSRDAASPALAVLAVPLVALVIVIAAAVVTRAAPQAPEQLQAPGVGRTIPGGRGVVEGRIVDASTGLPIPGARVDVRGRGIADSSLVTTDQDGRYETRPLAPGTYLVSVTAPGHALAFYGQSTSGGTALDVRAGSVVSNVNVSMQGTGGVSGRILDDRGRGLSGAYIELMVAHAAGSSNGPAWFGVAIYPRVAFAQSEADGAYHVTAPPGDYVLRAYIGKNVRPSKDAGHAYAATLYPGARAQDQAQTIRLEPGLEQYDVDFALVSSRTVRIAGTVVDPARDNLDGVRVSLRAVPSASDQSIQIGLDARGAFDARDIVPGTYIVTVTDPRLPSRWSSARKEIEITGDVTDLELRASATASVTGRLALDPRSTSRTNLSQVLIGARINMGDGALMNMSRFNTELDGTFSGDMPAGPLRLSVAGPPDWRVQSIMVDGVETFGRAIDIAPGPHEMVVVLTNRMSAVEGLVVDRRGTPLSGFDVVLFPADATQWYSMSPFIRQTRSRQNGRFELGSLPPGDYAAVAIQGVPPLLFVDPEPTLQRLQAIATRLKVADGEHKTISIRAAPTPEGLARFTP